MGTVARIKNNDLLLSGGVDARVPRIMNGLTNFFPLDGTTHDSMTEKYFSYLSQTERDFGFSITPFADYDYKNSTFHISGKLTCIEAVDRNVTIGLGFVFHDGTDYQWAFPLLIPARDLLGKWHEFSFYYTIPSNFAHSLRPYFLISIAGGVVGYKAEFRDVLYVMTDNPNIIDTNVALSNDFVAIEEASTNQIVNGNFENGLTNWVKDGIDSSLTLIDTPYGNGVRVNREDGNSGDWQLSYTGPKPASYLIGETWVWSFKYKKIRGPVARPFMFGWWINDGGYKNNLVAIETPLDDGWIHVQGSHKFTATFTGAVTMGLNSFFDFSTIDITDVQLEPRKSFNSEKIVGSKADALLNIKTRTPLASNFTLISEKSHRVENGFTNLALTKTSGNVFKMYKNGLETLEFKNKWAKYKVRGVGIDKNEGWDITKYTDPFEKSLQSDPISISHALSTEDFGYLFRTFVWSPIVQSVTHKYRVDNYAGIRINNGTPTSIGTYQTDNNLNPAVVINLVAGWNVIEIMFMDADAGGGLSLFTGTALSSIAGAYMTAECPIEFSTNEIYFNEKANTKVRNVGIYNRVLDDNEIKKLHSTNLGIAIDGSGTLRMNVKERSPFVPSDAYYFPLDHDGKDIHGFYNAAEEILPLWNNDRYHWVGSGFANQLYNGDGKIIVGPSVSDGRDPDLHQNALQVDGWSTGYNGGVQIPELGYHGQWVQEGVDGPRDPCMKFVDRNEFIGYPHRWLGIVQGMNSPTDLSWGIGNIITVSWIQKTDVSGKGATVGIYHKSIATGQYTFGPSYTFLPTTDIDIWEEKSFSFTIDSDWDLTFGQSIYVYGQDGPSGTLWVDNVSIHKGEFRKPFTPTTRADSKLAFNLNASIGLDWSKDWSILYHKIPVGSSTGTTKAGYNIDSLGCNGNTVGGGYVWYGKPSGANQISSSIPLDMNPLQYFNNPRMITLVKQGTTLTIREYDYFGNVHVRSQTVSTALVNHFVTQYGYDLLLGGYDNSNYANAYYRDLIVLKRALTEAEINKIFNTRIRIKGNTLYIPGILKEGLNL